MNYLVAYTLAPSEVSIIRRALSPTEIALRTMPLHITLVPPNEALVRSVETSHEFQCLKTVEPDAVDIAEFASFGSFHRQVLALKLQLKPDLVDLRRHVRGCAAKWQDTGQHEYRPFEPHITILRDSKSA